MPINRFQRPALGADIFNAPAWALNLSASQVLPRYKNKKETPMNPRIERSNKPCTPTQKVLHLFEHLNEA